MSRETLSRLSYYATEPEQERTMMYSLSLLKDNENDARAVRCVSSVRRTSSRQKLLKRFDGIDELVPRCGLEQKGRAYY